MHELAIHDSEMTALCRAALWYSDHVAVTGTKMHGIKAFRECSDVVIRDCDIASPEFGWSVRNIEMTDSVAESEYFMMRSEDMVFKNVTLKGKYSFQYIKNAVFENCNFDTKDAFLARRECRGAKQCRERRVPCMVRKTGLPLKNCKIIGTQPLCYCKNLKLIDCEMIETIPALKKSEVEARITTPVLSIKNPLSGTIVVPEAGEIIMDDENAKGEVRIISHT